MFEHLPEWSANDWTGFLAVALSLGIPIVAIVAYHFRASKKAEMEARLKQDMIARGMSADEIERVLKA
jgi:hypothetical protein